MKTIYKTGLFIIMLALTMFFALAENGVYDNTNYNEYNLSNITHITADGITSALTGNADTATTASNSNAWITLTSLQSKWLSDVGNVLTFDETELNSTIDDKTSDYIPLVSEGDLNVNHSDSTTLASDSTAWITMTSLMSK